MESLTKQIGGDHYQKRTIQPIEYILDNDLNFCEGCVIKYVTRWRDKGGVEDLMKAKHYLEFLIEQQTSLAAEAIAHNPNVGSVSNLAAKVDEAWEDLENFHDDPGDSQPKTTAISDPYPTDYRKYPDGY
jgi:hypothetical protein